MSSNRRQVEDMKTSSILLDLIIQMTLPIREHCLDNFQSMNEHIIVNSRVLSVHNEKRLFTYAP